MEHDFDAYVAARGDALHRHAFLLTRDHGLAEDLVQTSLVKCWRSWARIVGDPEPYVRQVMIRTFIAGWRRKWGDERPTQDLPDRPTSDHSADSAERITLDQALAALPRRQRAVIVLRYLDDLTERQTAEIMGISVGTVKSQSAKALARLRVSPALAVAISADQPHPSFNSKLHARP